MVNTNSNIFLKFLINVKRDRDSRNLFEMFLKSLKALAGSVNENFCTDDFEMDFEISKMGKVNLETWYFWFTFDNRFLPKEHKTSP